MPMFGPTAGSPFSLEVESYNAGVPADDLSRLSSNTSYKKRHRQWQGFTMAHDLSIHVRFLAYAETNCSSRHARGVVAIRAQSHEERLCAVLEIPGRGGDPYGVRRDLCRM